VLRETAEGFALALTDEDGIGAGAHLAHAREPARDADRAHQGIRELLSRLGNTDFAAEEVAIEFSALWFIPASALNALRREAVENLVQARRAAYRRPPRAQAREAVFPEAELGYCGNVYNESARAFYTRHGVTDVAPAFECNREEGAVPLMITRHCLRYSFNLCPRQVKGVRPEPLTLVRGKERYELRFDCPRCEMQVVGKTRQPG
jgi:putative protease